MCIAYHLFVICEGRQKPFSERVRARKQQMRDTLKLIWPLQRYHVHCNGYANKSTVSYLSFLDVVSHLYQTANIQNVQKSFNRWCSSGRWTKIDNNEKCEMMKKKDENRSINYIQNMDEKLYAHINYRISYFE